VELSYTPGFEGEPFDSVSLVGDFNEWDAEAAVMAEEVIGTWTTTVYLEPGAYPYRFLERFEWSIDAYEVAACDPAAPLIHCDEDYKEPSATDWTHTCETGVESACSSLLVVPDCAQPTFELTSLDIDRSAGTLAAVLEFTPGVDGADLDRVQLTLDGEPVSGSQDGDTVTLSLSDLAPGRHTLRASASDLDGRSSEPLYVPVWTDVSDPEQGWREGSVYYAFVDRLADGDVALNVDEGQSVELGGYMGGDLQGVRDLVPYLDDLGVRTIWLSNPQDNAEGAWDGQCEETFTGYHAYWPDDVQGVEEHFGTDETLHALVEEAHARDMRVIMDWVANHVHSDHPTYLAHGDDGWFNEMELCEDYVGGEMNFDRIPETCWFAPYLPDYDFTNPEPLAQVVDEALWWVKTYELDGLRVDAAKHMTHAVQWNLQSRIRAEIEHTEVGGTEQFWTVGETFDGYERIAAYMGPDQLDGQFDFPLYYTVNSTFAARSTHLGDLAEVAATSEATYAAAHDDALMSSFLGNHDVMRFLSYAEEGSVSACQGDTTLVSAGVPDGWSSYLRLRLAWAFLFTQPPVPLVYYGDEMGIPGYTDPDNRQPLWWHVGDVSGGAVGSVDDMLGLTSDPQDYVLDAVGRLGRARRDHPAMWRGSTTEWWVSPVEWPTLWGYARVDEQTGDQLLVILNNSDEEAWLTNALQFAGLTPDGTYVDVLTDDVFEADGDSLTVNVYDNGARVLLLE